MSGMALRTAVALSEEECYLLAEVVGEARSLLLPQDRPRLSPREQRVLAVISAAASEYRFRSGLLPLKQVAAMTGTSPRTLRDRAARGAIAAERRGRQWFVAVP